jgi:hypothetical protein
VKKGSWQYAEFGCRQGNWKRFRRAIYSRLLHDGHSQLYLPACRPDTVIVTNIGQGQAIDRFLKDAGVLDYLTANRLIACYHERGSDELANRAIKDFGHEQLPFKRLAPNAAWYYKMLVGHFLLESFKEDVGAPVVAIGFYASTAESLGLGKYLLFMKKNTYYFRNFCQPSFSIFWNGNEFLHGTFNASCYTRLRKNYEFCIEENLYEDRQGCQKQIK